MTEKARNKIKEHFLKGLDKWDNGDFTTYRFELEHFDDENFTMKRTLSVDTDVT